MSDTGSRPRNSPERLGDLPRSDMDNVPTSPDQPSSEAKRDRMEARIARRREAGSALARRGRENSETTRAPGIAEFEEPAVIQLLPNLPYAERRFSWGSAFVFFLIVILPTVIAGIYYFKYASNQYVAEFHFAVRSSTTTSTQPSATSMLSSLLGTSSSADSGENYLVTDYLTSRQAAEELQSKVNVKALYSKPEIDWWARFDSSQPMERFVSYWRGMMSANYDQITGIATAHVRAFSPADAELIATTLVKLAENLVNDISERPRREAVRFAESEVKRAEDRVKIIRAELTQFRSAESVIDPTAGAVQTNTTLVQALRQTLSQMQTDAASMSKQQIAPNAPQMVALQSRIKATRDQLALIESQVGATREGGKPLAQVVAKYEQLDLERQFAQNTLVSAMQSLEQARATVMTQRLYVTPFVRPATPESSTYPNRVVATLTVFGIALIIWIIGFLVVRSLREHIV